MTVGPTPHGTRQRSDLIIGSLADAPTKQARRPAAATKSQRIRLAADTPTPLRIASASGWRRLPPPAASCCGCTAPAARATRAAPRSRPTSPPRSSPPPSASPSPPLLPPPSPATVRTSTHYQVPYQYDRGSLFNRIKCLLCNCKRERNCFAFVHTLFDIKR